jgi:hypothetical protein
VRLIVSNNCGSDTVMTSINIGGVGTGNINLSSEALSLYPNPANSVITLETRSGLKMQSVTVLNAVGAAVLHLDHPGTRKESIDISLLPSGAYMIRINTDAGIIVRRLQVIK